MEDRADQDRRDIESVLRGDTSAFAPLVARYQRLVASVAWRYGVGRNEIEDIVSEVFTKVFRNLGRYSPEHPFSTWLYRLAANHVMDHGRRARRERGRSEMPAQVTDTSPGPRETLETRERAGLLRAALEQVPDRYRQALFLVYLEGLRVDEAASTLGVPTGTVKSRLLRGREALRKILARRHQDLFGEDRAMS